jgi:heme-degrading monooxygenase HmoA
MFEVNLLYDFVPGIDRAEYLEWAERVIGMIMQSPGLVEFRAQRNVLGSPFIRTTTIWKTQADWVNFFESAKWQEIEAELRARFAINIAVEFWVPSPVVPETLKP